MKISVPNIPLGNLHITPAISKTAAVERLAEFLAPGNVLVITGAGVSVDSGIRAYRGKDGTYTNPNYKCVLPMQITLLCASFADITRRPIYVGTPFVKSGLRC